MCDYIVRQHKLLTAIYQTKTYTSHTLIRVSYPRICRKKTVGHQHSMVKCDYPHLLYVSSKPGHIVSHFDFSKLVNSASKLAYYCADSIFMLTHKEKYVHESTIT